MNVPDIAGKNGGHAADAGGATTRLSGPWLHIARAVWLALVVPSVGLFIANLFAYDRQLQQACVGPMLCNLTGALTAKQLQAFAGSGFSVGLYAALLTISLALIVSIWCGIGFLIFWRRSDDWLALLAAFFLVMFSITPAGNNPGFILFFSYPFLALPISLVSFLGQISTGVFFSFFPNGRLIPRWMGMVLLFYIIYAFFNNFPSPASAFDMNWPAWLNLLLGTLVFPAAFLIAQIYRYRRVSTALQRQQTKWILLGVAVAIGILIGLTVIALLVQSGAQQYALGGAGGVTVSFIFFCSFLLIPLSIGFSILRYRLYDIDVLINRALVYGSLTTLLALLYFGLIFALQSLFQGILHQNSGLVVVVSTLTIAALFQPLRRRIQQVIDHRFYRRKYNAAQTVEAFSATLRNEVDLSQLSEHLLAVVQETMQPTQVSLWLRQAEPTTKRQAAGTSHVRES